MNSEHQDRFEVFRRLALQGAAGIDLSLSAQTALKLASEFVGLEAATLLLFDQTFAVSMTVTHATSDSQRQRLASMEESLFSTLRKEKKLSLAYLTFDDERPVHLFTLPVKFKGKTLGAVIGLQEGKRTVISEDQFMEALSALLALIYTASRADGKADQTALDKERMAGILDTAVTVNHEVNNPLTAILGNVQLLLLKREDLDDELKAKLKVVEEAAMKIKGVTQKLLAVTSPRTKKYTDDTTMLDLSGDDD